MNHLPQKHLKEETFMTICESCDIVTVKGRVQPVTLSKN